MERSKRDTKRDQEEGSARGKEEFVGVLATSCLGCRTPLLPWAEERGDGAMAGRLVGRRLLLLLLLRSGGSGWGSGLGRGGRLSSGGGGRLFLALLLPPREERLERLGSADAHAWHRPHHILQVLEGPEENHLLGELRAHAWQGLQLLRRRCVHIHFLTHIVSVINRARP